MQVEEDQPLENGDAVHEDEVHEDDVHEDEVFTISFPYKILFLCYKFDLIMLLYQP